MSAPIWSTDKPTIEQLQAEIEKLSRSRDYWKKKVKDDDRRILYERNEARWKENKVKAEFGTDEFSEFLREQYKREVEIAAKQYGLQIPMPLSVWRRLVQLAHPDKHGGIDSAIEATQWLLKNRPEGTL